MRSVAALIIALVPAVAAPTRAQAPPAASPIPPVASPQAPDAAPQRLPLYLSPDRALLMLRLAGQPPVPVVFDTGASGNVVDLALANKLGLPDTGPSDSFDGQGTPVPGHRTRLVGASVGGVALPPTEALAAAYDQPDEVGILSPNAFAGRLVRVDLERGRLTLLPRTQANTPCGPAYPYSHDFSFMADPADTLPSVPVRVNGQTITAEVDTGNNSGLILPTSYIPRLPLEGKPVVVGYGQSQVGREEVLAGRLSVDIEVAGVVVPRPEVLFMAAHKPNVGLAILRRFELVLDPTGQRDWLLPKGAPAPCGPAPPGS